MVMSALDQVYHERLPVPALAERVAREWFRAVSLRSVPY
jgi:hypothetical protein